MKGKRILVVEDNDINRQLVCDILSHAGCEIAQACSVEEGRLRLEEFTPDLVLMDIRIPGGGGELLLQEIREKPALAAVPVIAVTAFAMPGDREKLLKSGFDGYLSKPIDVRSFARTVAAYLT
jgi:two-component system, cell cycle response regulator DivK